VEEMIRAAVDDGDYQPFEDLLNIVTNPWQDQPASERYATPALPEQCVTQTFCGT